MSIKKLLKLLHKKHPIKDDKTVPAILVYEDGSGIIVKNPLLEMYAYENKVFAFDTIEQLIEYLESK